jgi:hypothetical protein
VDREARAKSVRNAIAITRMEGGQPSEYCLKQLALFEAGEISATEMRDRVIRNAARQSQRRPATRTLRGWAISVLQEAGAIHECEEHGWMQDRADPHARERAMLVARQNPPVGLRTRRRPRSKTFSARLTMPALSARPLSDRGSLLAQF